MHYVAHRSNHAVQCVSDLEMEARIETILVALHKYFSKSPKCHLDFQKLVELLGFKGEFFFQNINKVDFNVESIETCFCRSTAPFW